MKYYLYSLGAKNLPSLKEVFSGTHAECNREMTARRQIDKKNEFAVYDESGRLVSSTHSGGATPHTWDTRASGRSRKLSGLSTFKSKNKVA